MSPVQSGNPRAMPESGTHSGICSRTGCGQCLSPLETNAQIMSAHQSWVALTAKECK